MDLFNNNLDEYPYKINEIESEVNAQLLSHFHGKKEPYIQVGPKKYVFASGFKQDLTHYYNFQPRPDDTWVITFPRSGTTWMQEIVWLLANNLNYEKAAKTPLAERFPFLEFSSCVHPEIKKQFLEYNKHSERNLKQIEKLCSPVWKFLQDVPGPRFIKTHLPFSLLNPNLLEIGCKVIYVARNPKDVAVSYYHLSKLFKTEGYCGDFPLFWDYFEHNLLSWTPYWSHIEEGWQRRYNKNLLFLFYEDLNRDVCGTLEKVSTFLTKTYTKIQFQTLENHLKIDNFRNNKSVNFDDLKELGITNSETDFVRKGKIGGWKDYFRGDMNERADKWIKDNLRNINIEFPLQLF